ncbi:MAG: glycosyltransferase [Candidatus Limnocylindrales bacterium]
MSTTIVLFVPGLDDGMIWGEHIVAHGQKRALERAIPGATVHILGEVDRPAIREMRVDLLISSFTGPHAPWRVDDIADDVGGISLLSILNRPDLLDEFAALPFDGFITNSERGAAKLAEHRPARWLPLGVDPALGPVAPQDRYRGDVVFLGSGGRGNKRPATTEHFLGPAKVFDLHIWGAAWEESYWAPVYADQPERNDWHRYWHGLLPVDDIAPLYSSARIVLGYHEDRQREWGMWNNRVFEALACGAFLICDEPAGLADVLGEALIFTRGGEETAALIAEYLERPDDRRRRAELGRRIVTACYTYDHWARGLRAFYEELRDSR